MSVVDLKDILECLGNDAYKKVGKKYVEVERANLLFSTPEIQNDLVNDEEAWPEAFRHISVAVEIECDENVARQAEKKKSTSFKHQVFHLYKDMINTQLTALTESVDLDCLIKGLLLCLQKNTALKALDAASTDTWITTLELISDILKVYPPSDLSYFNLKTLWNNCIDYLQDTVKNQGQKFERAKLADILAKVALNLHSTHYFSQMAKVIKKVGGLVKDFKWSLKDPAKTALLIIVNAIVEHNADRYRELLLETFTSLAEERIRDLEITNSYERIQLSNVSPIKQEKILDGEEEMSYSKALYSFTEYIFVLACPDCELLDIDQVSFYLNQCSEFLFQQLDERIRRCMNNRKNFVLPKSKIRLLARVALLHHLHEKVVSQDSYSPSAKRKKGISFLMEFANTARYAHLQILEEVLIRWSHRLDDDDLDSIAGALAELDKKALKKDEKLELYMRTMAVLLEKKRNLKKEIYDELWNYALSLIQMPSTHDAACNLLCSVLPYYIEVLSTKPFHVMRAISFQLAQLSFYRESTIRLLHAMLQFFEFDERAVFRVDRRTSDDWTFRTQVLGTVLEFAEADPEVVFELVKAILVYHPKQIPLKPSTSKLEICLFEPILVEQYCSKFPPTDVVVNQCNIAEECISILIPRFVDFVNEYWEENVENFDRRVFLWKMCLLASETLSNSDIFGQLLEAYEIQIIEELDEADEVMKLRILENLNVGSLWVQARRNLKRAIEDLTDEGINICWKFRIFWDFNVPLSRDIIADSKILKSKHIDQLFLDNLEKLSVEDLLMIMTKFGPSLKPDTNLKIIQQTLLEISNDYQFSSIPDVTQAYKERFAYTVFQFINLRLIDFLAIRDQLLSCLNNPGFGLAKIPLQFVDDTYLTNVLDEADKYVFCRVFQAALNDFKDRFVPEPILKAVLNYDYEFMEKYIDNFREYYEFFEPILATFVESEKVRFKGQWKKKLETALKGPIPKLLNGKVASIDDKLSPMVFCLPQEWISQLFEVNSFASNWLSWSNDPSVYHRVFRRLRHRIYDLRNSPVTLEINYPMVILRNLIIMIEKYQSLEGYNYASDEIVSLITALINDAVERCSDGTLNCVIKDLIYLFNNGWLSVFKALVIVDILKHNAEKFPITCQNLLSMKLLPVTNADESPPFNYFKEYMDYVFSDFTTDPPRFLVEDVRTTINNGYKIDIVEYSPQTFGFWEIMRKEMEIHLHQGVFQCVMPFWMFFPRLRPVLTRIFVLFPDDVIRSVVKNHHYFMIALWEFIDFPRLVPQITPLLLYDPIVIHEPEVNDSLYELVTATARQKTPSQSSMKLSFEMVNIDSSNYCALILKNMTTDITMKSWLEKFFIVCYQIPICAGLALIRMVPILSNDGRRKLIKLVNETFHNILLEEKDNIRSRQSSARKTQIPFSFNFSQTLSIPTCSSPASTTSSVESVFDSESATVFLYAAMSLVEHPDICINYFELLSFCKCLTAAKMFKEAHFLLKYFIDHQEFPNRWNFMFKCTGSLLEVINDVELRNLMLEVLIGLKNYVAVSQLPLAIRTKDEARLFLAECNQDWGAMTSICNSIGDRDRQATALLAFGSLPTDCSKEVLYESLTKMGVFDGSVVSFPKEVASIWERIWSTIKRHNDEKPYGKWQFLNDSIDDLSKKSVVDLKKLHDCRHLMLLKDLTEKGDSKIPDGVLRCSFHLANISRKSLQGNSLNENMLASAVEAISTRTKALRKSGAQLCSLKLLHTYNSHVFKPFLPNDRVDEMILEKAKALNAIGERDMAIISLTKLIENDQKRSLKEKAILSRAAKLLAKLQVGLEQKYLDIAVKISEEPGRELYSKNLVKLGLFMEKEYQSHQDFMESNAFQLKQECVENISTIPKKKPEKTQRQLTEEEREERLREYVLEAELKIEQTEIETIKSQRKKSLYSCVKHYIDAIINLHNDATIMYRLVALLIKNTTDKGLMNIIMDKLPQIPSNLWLCVMNLLSSHLFSNDPISNVVEKIAIMVLSNYPYHSADIFLFYREDQTKIQAVSRLFEQVEKKCPDAGRIIIEISKAHKCFTEAGITDTQDSTYFTQVDERGKVFEMTSNLRLIKHKENLTRIPVPTIPQEVYPPGDFKNLDASCFITIKDIYLQIQLADGNSAPKIITFLGSDDQEYRVIFKKEDLRKDSLIQQLFSLTNFLMSQNPACPRNFNLLTTYNVLPLSSECGLIEFCRDTKSLCEYLIGEDKKSGAHKMYRPRDTSVLDARMKLHEAQKHGDPRNCFMEICKEVQPVFRYYFYERFRSALDFHAAIDRYTQSLAQWSIVCYIIGLGDRHLSNIRIDNAGNLIHIDLGMVFEYSRRVLPVPEKIPFRLTRDLVDPILIDGINGELRRIAIHTLQQLRDNGQVICGVASTLLHDPVSTFAAKPIGNNVDGDQPRHFVAETAISRLREKLAGRGLSLQVMTAEQQVDKLLQEATDVENLCRLIPLTPLEELISFNTLLKGYFEVSYNYCGRWGKPKFHKGRHQLRFSQTYAIILIYIMQKKSKGFLIDVRDIVTVTFSSTRSYRRRGDVYVGECSSKATLDLGFGKIVIDFLNSPQSQRWMLALSAVHQGSRIRRSVNPSIWVDGKLIYDSTLKKDKNKIKNPGYSRNSTVPMNITEKKKEDVIEGSGFSQCHQPPPRRNFVKVSFSDSDLMRLNKHFTEASSNASVHQAPLIQIEPILIKKDTSNVAELKTGLHPVKFREITPRLLSTTDTVQTKVEQINKVDSISVDETNVNFNPITSIQRPSSLASDSGISLQKNSDVDEVSVEIEDNRSKSSKWLFQPSVLNNVHEKKNHQHQMAQGLRDYQKKDILKTDNNKKDQDPFNWDKWTSELNWLLKEENTNDTNHLTPLPVVLSTLILPPIVKETTYLEPVVQKIVKLEPVGEKIVKVEPISEKASRQDPVVEKAMKQESSVETTLDQGFRIDKGTKCEQVIEKVPRQELVIEKNLKQKLDVEKAIKLEPVAENPTELQIHSSKTTVSLHGTSMHWRDRLSLKVADQSDAETDDEPWVPDTSSRFVVVHKRPSHKKFYPHELRLIHRKPNRNAVFDFWRNMESGQFKSKPK